MIQCAGCRLKCARCGFQVEEESYLLPDLDVTLCRSCQVEYAAFQKRLQGVVDEELYWQNEAWQESWSTWIKHQKAMAAFRRSKEFQRLLSELIHL